MEFVTKKEFHDLTTKVVALEKDVKDEFIKLEKDVKDEFTKLNQTLDTIAKQCSEIKHNDNNSIQFRNDTARMLADIKFGLEDHEDKNHVGIFGQVKKNKIETDLKIIELNTKIEVLEKRVKDIEDVDKFDKKVFNYKKGIFYTICGSIGLSLKPIFLWIVDKIF